MPDLLEATPTTAEGAQPRGADLLAQTLRTRGVSTMFTLPGGHILQLLDAADREGLRVVDTRHEGAAVLAAEGWALATGATGVAAVTAGPGFANGLIGLMDAGAWSVPLLMIAGRTGTDRQGRGAVMDVDQRAIAAPAAKWAASCASPGLVPQYTARALYEARAGCPGAVYLDVPWDVMRATPAALDIAPAEFPDDPPAPAGSADALGSALASLRAAKRPVILAGSGAFWSGAGEAIARFAELSGIPVITASAARGVVADSHPLCLGSLVHAGIALPSSDCVLVLGSAFNANVLYGGPPLFGSEQTIIQVDIDAGRMGGNRRADVAVAGDVTQVVRDLTAGWRTSDSLDAEWLDQARSLAAASLQYWDQQIDGHHGRALHAGALAREVAGFARERCSGDVTFVADGGDALAWPLAYFYAENPGRLLTTTTALGTLGVGMPFAIAAALARPAEPVFLFVGDGSFGLTAMEVETAARHGLFIVVIVSNNAGWGDVRHEQDAFFGPDRHVASNLSPARYDRLAEALGAAGEHVEQLAEVRPALQRAVERGGCTVIDAATDPTVLAELLRVMGSAGLM